MVVGVVPSKLIAVLGPKTSSNLPWPDIGHLAKWSVSSYKFGFGAECLRDDDQETFWQYVVASRETVTSATN